MFQVPMALLLNFSPEDEDSLFLRNAGICQRRQNPEEQNLQHKNVFYLRFEDLSNSITMSR